MIYIKNQEGKYKADECYRYNCKYYVVFCTKFNRCIFVEKYKDALSEIISEIRNEELTFDIDDYIISADTIQCIISCPPTISMKKCIHTLKSIISKKLYEKCPELKSRMPQIWTKKSFIVSMGDVNIEEVCRYIDNHKKGEI